MWPFQICRRPLTLCLVSVSGGHCDLKVYLRPILSETCTTTLLLQLGLWLATLNLFRCVRYTLIRGSLGFRNVSDKLQERHLRKYGHVAHQPKNYCGCKCLAMAVSGVRPPRRPKKRCLEILMHNMRTNGLTTEDVKDRAKCGRLSWEADPGRDLCHEKRHFRLKYRLLLQLINRCTQE